jgi:multidrug efflux pump subunit AcrA (membrane-fusion protein)
MNKLMENAAMKHNSRLLYVIVIFSLLLVGCGSSGQDSASTSESDATSDFGAVISATGVVVPEQWATLSMRNPGVIDEVLVKEGQQVKMGQPLVRLGNSESAQAEVARARENLIIAERIFNSSQANALTYLDMPTNRCAKRSMTSMTLTFHTIFPA